MSEKYEDVPQYRERKGEEDRRGSDSLIDFSIIIHDIGMRSTSVFFHISCYSLDTRHRQNKTS